MFPHVGLSYVKFLSVNIENYIYLDLNSYRLESFLKTANTAVISNSLTFYKRISQTVVKTPLETFRRRVDFPYRTGLFLLIFALSWQITLCELQNMRCFYQPLPWKSLTGIIITFVLFFRSKISHARWKISLQETTLLLTSGLLITAGQRKSVLWSLQTPGWFCVWLFKELVFLRIDHAFWKARWKFLLQNGVVRFYCFTGRFWSEESHWSTQIMIFFGGRSDESSNSKGMKWKSKSSRNSTRYSHTNFVTVLLLYCFEPYNIFLCSSWLTLT